MKLRQMAAVFLFNEKNDVLLLQKKSDKDFLSGHLVPIGGHMECDEINDPNIACLREIEEETGLMNKDIDGIRLRYIVHRLKDNNEIRIQYVYFGNVKEDSELVESDEGKLIWINCTEILKKNVTATTKEIITHYLTVGQKTEQIYVGSMKSCRGEPQITWALLEDWETHSKA